MYIEKETCLLHIIFSNYREREKEGKERKIEARKHDDECRQSKNLCCNTTKS